MTIYDNSSFFKDDGFGSTAGSLIEGSDWVDDALLELANAKVGPVVSLFGDNDGQAIVFNAAQALEAMADVTLSVEMSEEASGGVQIDHTDSCSCAACSGNGNGFDDPIAADGTGDDLGGATSAEAFGTLSDLADYLVDGYWSDNATVSRKFNLTDTGVNAKSGVLHYNVEGFALAGSAGTDISGLSDARADLVRDVLDVFSAVLGITFVETDSSDVTYTDLFFKDTGAGSAYASSIGYSDGIQYSYINIGQDWSGSTSTYNDYTLQTIFHEIGHALGLGHQGFYNGSGTYATDANFGNDSWQASMMSYFSQIDNTEVDADGAFLQTPMAVDWIALQDIYGDQSYGGTDFGTNNAFTDDTTYGFNTTITDDVSAIWAAFSDYADLTASTIIDADGIDTLDVSGYSTDQRIDLTVTLDTDTSATTMDIGGLTGNLTLAAGTVIEHAIGGSGDDDITGNDENNELWGKGGDDTLRGGLGNDKIVGGADNDVILGEKGKDELYGGIGDDVLRGGNNTDILIGGAGYDRLYGNAASDTFRFKSISDSENGNQLDRIGDFEVGVDLFDLSFMFETTLDMAIGGSFTGTGASAVTHENNGNSLVSVDSDGDLVWDFRVVVLDTVGMTLDDFLL